MRYIGNVIRCYKPMLKDQTNTNPVTNASGLLLLEAAARVVKNELNALLRHQMQELKLPLEVLFCLHRPFSSYDGTLVLNDLFGD